MTGFERRVLRVLEACRDSGERVGFHRWGDDPTIFLVGRVRSVDRDSVEAELVSPTAAASPPS